MANVNYDDHDNRLMETSTRILEVFRENNVEQLRLDLWEWLKYLDCEEFSEPHDFSDIYKSIITLIDGAWETLRRFKEDGFKHYSCVEPMEPGPCLKRMHSEKEERARQFRKRMVHYSGKILHLDQGELYDFYLAFDNFFHYATLASWKTRLYEGSRCSRDKQPFGTKGILYQYERLAKLIEACFLLTRMLLNEIKSYPHFGYMERDWVAANINIKDCDSPYENVNYAFACFNASQYKKQLKRWYKCATSDTRMWDYDEPGRLLLLYQFIQLMLDNAWIIYGCDEILTRWKKEPYENEQMYNKPKLESQKGIERLSLSEDEVKEPHLVFSAFFGNHHLTYDKIILQDWLRAALFSDTAESKAEDFFLALNKVIEAWYLINFRLCHHDKDPLVFTEETKTKQKDKTKSDPNIN